MVDPTYGKSPASEQSTNDTQSDHWRKAHYATVRESANSTLRGVEAPKSLKLPTKRQTRNIVWALLQVRAEHRRFKTEPDRKNWPNRQKPSRPDNPAVRFFMIFGFGSVRFGPKPKKHTQTHEPNRTDGPDTKRTELTIFGSVGFGFSWFSVFGFVGSCRVGFKPMLSPRWRVLNIPASMITTHMGMCSPLTYPAETCGVT